jgi:hypothetical protein
MLFLITSSIYCQNGSYISVGMNVIDDSFTSSYNPFEVYKTWHTGRLPSYFSITNQIGKRVLLELQVTTNTYDKGKLVDGNLLTASKKYFSTDLLAKYMLISSDDDSFLFDPFIVTGAGYTTIDTSKFYTINYGVGLYYWFNNSNYCNCNYGNQSGGEFGMLFSSIAKSSIEQDLYGNQIQYNLGLVYRIN